MSDDENLTGMWKGSSDIIQLTDHVDAGRTDLFEAFDRDPLARHDIELQTMISGVRGSSRIPRFVLSRVEFGRWLVTQISAERGGPATIVSPQIFDDARDAERYVFQLRLGLLRNLAPASSEEAIA